MPLNKSIIEKIYYNFLKIRMCQEQIALRYHPADKMKCPMHLCIGQELIPAILSQLLKKNDSIFSHHRSHGYFLANKGSMQEMIAEFYGKKTGTNGGLAGSQELSCTKTSFYSGTILSGAFAMAVGDAFTKIMNNKDEISIAVIGDGGMEEGITFEAINLAVLMNLPVLFICENNQYSTHTNIRERSATKKILPRVKGFGIKNHFIKTDNVNSIYNNLNKIISSIRKNKKPAFIEFMTYRFNGHVGPEGDDHYNYRPQKELKLWKKNDPLLKLEKNISVIKKNKISNEILKEINSSFNFAEKSKYPISSSQFNYNGTYSKLVKKFYNNKNMLVSEQEHHRPKPY